MNRILFFLSLTWCFACHSGEKEIPFDEITKYGIRAKFYKVPENSLNPIIVLLSGSGGSFISDHAIKGLLLSGYDVFSLAYFGLKGLPSVIEHVPLEYVHQAISYVKKEAPDRKVVLLGISKGAELALCYASRYSAIDGLICYAPSSIVLPHHVKRNLDDPLKSSWTWKGEELPFAQLASFSDPPGEVVYKKYMVPVLFSDAELQKSSIAVEQIVCPVLLLAGKDDLVWPTYEMSLLARHRMLEQDSTKQVRLVGYDDCGHQFFWFSSGEPSATTSQSARITGIKKHRFIYGGTQAGTQRAMIASRNEVLEFLGSL